MQRREPKIGPRDRKRPRRPNERNDTGQNPHGSDLSGVGAGICGFVGLGGGREVSGSATNIEQIATRQKCSVRQVNMTISLAFLAPDLVKAAVEGRLPRGIGVERLRDAPAEWGRQFETLGLNPQ